MAFDDDWDAEGGNVDYFDAALAQKHLLIIRAFDAPRYYRTENNPDGLVHPGRGRDFEPFANTVVRAAIADLDAEDEDGQLIGPKIYPDAVLFPFSLTKVAKLWVGKKPQLVMWRKTGSKQTDPYEVRNMRTDDDAVKAGVAFLDAHPEFLELKAPEPYDERPPSRDRDRNRERDDGWARDDRGSGRGNRDMPTRYRDADRDPGPREMVTRYRDADRGSRDWGQHDDRRQAAPEQRRGTHDEDSWSREPRRERPRDDRGGSFLDRSANSSRNGVQEEEPPF